MSYFNEYEQPIFNGILLRTSSKKKRNTTENCLLEAAKGKAWRETVCSNVFIALNHIYFQSSVPSLDAY